MINMYLQHINGSYEESYAKMPSLCAAVTTMNKDIIATFSWDEADMTFETVTISFDAQIQGFNNGCRAAIGLDASHLKGKLGGVMMCATALDSQNCLFPLAIMGCRTEDYPNWHKFLKDLKPKFVHRRGLTFMSDRQRGLKESVAELFPEANHRFCFRHLYKNFKIAFKGPKLMNIVWNAGKAYKKSHWNQHMDALKKVDEDAWVYLMQEEPSCWARSHFSHDCAFEHINNNFSESNNAMCSKIRDKPVCKLINMYTQMIMDLFAKRSAIADSWESGKLVSTAVNLIEKMTDNIGKFSTGPSQIRKLYEVTNKATTKIFTVDIIEKTCTCVQWQLRDFPCQHVVCVLVTIRPDWPKYCSKYYTTDFYKITYSWEITPLGDKEDWPEVEGIEIKAPPLLREPGRPCVNRKRSWTEMNTIAEKKARRCSTCGGANHNRRRCKGGEVGSNPKKKKARVEWEVNGSSFNTTTVAPKKMPTGTKIKRSRCKKSTPKMSKSDASSSSAATKVKGKQIKEKKTTTAVTVNINNMNKGPLKQTVNNINYDVGSKRLRKPKVHFDL